MISLYVSSTWRVGSSHVTPRDNRKSEGRCAALAASTEQILSGAQAEAPFDGPAVEQPAADTLTDHDAGEGGRQTNDAAEHESSLMANLHLDPGARRAPTVDRLGVFRDEAFVSTFLDDAPGREAVIRETSRGVDHARPGDLLLKHGASSVERQTANVQAVDMQTVERHEDGRRARLLGYRAVEQMKLADQILVEHAPALVRCGLLHLAQMRPSVATMHARRQHQVMHAHDAANPFAVVAGAEHPIHHRPHAPIAIRRPAVRDRADLLQHGRVVHAAIEPRGVRARRVIGQTYRLRQHRSQ
jgi:hypothetical protein